MENDVEGANDSKQPGAAAGLKFQIGCGLFVAVVGLALAANEPGDAPWYLLLLRAAMVLAGAALALVSWRRLKNLRR